MNSRSPTPKETPCAGVQADCRQRLQAWHKLFVLCSQNPSRKRARELRVFTQRLLAEVSYCRHNEELNAKAVRTAKRWEKQGKNLRRALSSVREADACLVKLAGLRGAAAGTSKKMCPSRRCLLQIVRLETELGRQRESAAKALLVRMKDRRASLERLQGRLMKRLSAPLQRLGSRSPSIGKELLAGLEKEFPQIESAHLHSFRKRVKQVRSIVEIAALSDPQARAQAAALKKMQGATGAWRDWQVLAAKAADSKADELAELLRVKAEQALQKALGQCRRGMVQLRGSAEDGLRRPPSSPTHEG